MNAQEYAKEWLERTQLGWEDSDDLETLIETIQAAIDAALAEK